MDRNYCDAVLQVISNLGITLPTAMAGRIQSMNFEQLLNWQNELSFDEWMSMIAPFFAEINLINRDPATVKNTFTVIMRCKNDSNAMATVVTYILVTLPLHLSMPLW